MMAFGGTMLYSLVAISVIFGVANANSGWESARATFYGPSDAIDGMGILVNLCLNYKKLIKFKL